MPAKRSTNKRSILATLLSSVASKLVGWGSGYNATDPTRKVIDSATLFPSRNTANELLNANIGSLRAFCRDLERNNATARAGVEGLTALLVGTGISLEPDTGSEQLDELFRTEFNAWCQHAMVDGSSIYHAQSLGVREIVTAGEGIWRIVSDPDAEARGEIPWRILPLDAEWLSDTNGGSNDFTTVAGIQIDSLGRPVAYLLCSPETGAEPELVPSKWVIHFFERRRPVQHRGEPWFAPVIETLMQEQDLIDAELAAAKNSAAIGLAIVSETQETLDSSNYGTPTDPQQTLRIGGIARLYPGEDIRSFQNTRPSQQIAPFSQFLRGRIAASLRLPVRFLDRDVSRANYSIMRADMIDTERILSPIREWYGHATIGEMYRRVLPLIAARLGVPVPRANYRLLPDEQPYVDPQKDIEAALLAITGGLSTYEREIGKRGGDWRQVWAQRVKEQTLSGGPELTDGLPKAEQAMIPGEQGEDEDEDEGENDSEDDNEDQQPSDAMSEEREARRHARSMELARASAPVVHVGAPVVHVAPAAAPEVRVDVSPTPIEIVNPAPTVTVCNDVQPTPVTVENAITVEPAKPTRQAAPIVNVAAPAVTVQNEVIVPQRPVKAVPQRDGSVLMSPQE